LNDRLVELFWSQGFFLVLSTFLTTYWVIALKALVRWLRRTSRTTGIVVAHPVRSAGGFLHNLRHTSHNVTLDIQYQDQFGTTHLLRSSTTDASETKYNSKWYHWMFVGVPHFAIGSAVLVDYNPKRPKDSSFSADNIKYTRISLAIMNIIMGFISITIISGTVSNSIKCLSTEHLCSTQSKRK
jgi:hypothetical protein